MHEVVLHPIGVKLSGFRLADLDRRAAVALCGLLARHGVIVAPDQHLDDATFVATLKQFGELTFTEGETAVEGFPDLNVVSNVGRASPPRSSFHADTTYVRQPPAYTALWAIEIPARGGETLFTNQYRAYETLPDDVRARLEGRTMRHVVTGLDLGEGAETSADHPVFRRHPISHRTALYMSTPQRCTAISGMGEDEARDMIQYLFDHSTREDNTYRHAWSRDDVVMWDNGCVLHRGDHADVVGNRVMHRGMVAAYSAT